MLNKTSNMTSCSTFIFSCLLLSVFGAGSLVLAETGCPPAENIAPCVCDDTTSTRLVCSSVLEISTLEQVFRNSARYTFQEVHIRSSSMMYLPSIDEVRINELYINNSHFIELFYDTRGSKTLEKLQLDNTTFGRGFVQTVNLTKFTNLKTLVVNHVRVQSIPLFKRNFPSSLRQIILHGTETRKIIPGAFDGFPLLDKLEVSSSNLKNLSRGVFPTPFKVRFLYFDNNNISSIPHDLFSDMPELQFLSMKNNRITEVPEAAFGYRRTIPYLRLDGNPLQCNCLLVWLVKNKPEIIGGNCHTPRNLLGKQLQDLLPGDFNC